MGMTDDDLKALADAYACSFACDRRGLKQAIDRLSKEAVDELLIAVARLRSECRRKLGGGQAPAQRRERQAQRSFRPRA